jgi:putative DNA primase/helicase
MSDPIEHFRLAIAAAGLQAPDSINPGGAIHRFNTSGRRGDDSGWYMLHTDGIPAGAFGCWRTGLQSTWCAKSDTAMTHAEREAHRQRIKAMKVQREADVTERHEVAAVQAAQRLAAAAPCTQHAYTNTKGVKCHDLKVDAAGVLIVPMRDTAGTLHSLQTIAPDGDKRFMTGGRVKGCYHSIGKPAGVLVICEGYATGASIHECTDHAVAVAFNAGNMAPVATALHSKYPGLKIIIAADDDHLTDGNPGVDKATAAAQAVGGLLAVPSFPAGRGDKDTDFNDLHQLAGADAVKACIDNAIKSIAFSGDNEGATGHIDTWPEVQSLIAKTEAQDYPLDALPPLIRNAVIEVCGFVKAPVALVAMSTLAALSVAIQAHTDVQRAVKLEGPCGLFLCGIADSGERKTSCDGYFTTAIHAYQTRERENAKPLIQAYETDLDVWKAKRGGVQEKIKSQAKDGKPTNLLEDQLHNLDRDKPKRPRVPRLIYSDATPEALASSLVNGWPSGGVFSNEGGIVLGGHAMNKDVAMRNMARLNQLWDGKIAATDRATTESYGDTTARLTMSLQVQEPTLRAFFDNTKGLARGTGFLARFLVAWPESTMGTRMFTPPPDGWPALAAFNNRLTAILDRQAPVDEDGILTPAMLTLSPEAKLLWIAFHDQIEGLLATGSELYDLRDVGSKAADNVVRMAALFHAFAGSIGPIDSDCVELAVQIVTWHLLEAKRFLGELAMPAELANPMRLEKWMLDYCRREGTDKVPTREVERHGPSGLRNKAIINEAVKELAELGRARTVQDGKKKLIQINPVLLAGDAS